MIVQACSVSLVILLASSVSASRSPLQRFHRNAHDSDWFNVTADLLRESNISTWYSLDQYLNNTDKLDELLAHPLEGEHCFFNSYCTNDPDRPARRVINIWLRCNQLDNLVDLRKRFDSLYHLLEERTKFESHKLCSLQGQTSLIRLRLDFLLSESKLHDIVEVLERVWQPHHANKTQQVAIVIEHLTLAGMGLKDDDFKHLLSLIQADLEVLNLTGNALTSISFEGKKLAQLTTLDVSSNRLISLNVSQLDRLLRLDVHNNSMVQLDREQLPAHLLNDHVNFINQQIPFFRYELNLADNRWDCANEQNGWFIFDFITPLLRRQDNLFSGGRPRLWKSNEPECETPQAVRWFPFSVLASVKQADICKLCQCYIETKYALAHYRYMVVNCSARGLSEVPLSLPKNVRTVDLSNNEIKNLLPFAQSVALSPEWLDVRHLDLRNNSIESIEGIEKLRATKIELEGNLLTEVPFYLIEMLIAQKHIDKMSFGHNPYVCECETIKLKRWVSDHYSDSILLDPQHIRCGDLRAELQDDPNVLERFSIDRSHRFYRQEVTTLENVLLCPHMFWWQPYHLYFNILLALLIILLVAKIVYDYFWQRRTGKLPRFFKLNH